MEIFPVLPEDFASLSDEDLATFINDTSKALRDVAADPSSFVNEDLSSADLLTAAREASENLADAKDEAASRLTAEVAEVEETEELSPEEFAAELEALAAETEDEEVEDEPAEVEEVEVETAAVEEPVVASAAPRPKRRPLPRPSARHRAPEAREERVALTAAGSLEGFEKGEAFSSPEEIARVMQARRRNFGIVAPGTSGEKIPIVRADWSHLYSEDRRLSADPYRNEALIASVVDQVGIRTELTRRKKGALTASGGLCAPVTPYYNLQMISVADRPVRAALPAFNADRGGIKSARPASLASITTAVGTKTAAQDAAGGTTATKTCQVVDCPQFDEYDVEIIFHCLQFGNLGARTFPERVTQWNDLTLAAHARLAESVLLTGIDTASTQVTAANLGLGASATLPSQILTAAAGMRSRHRMDPEAVLRVMLPQWVLDLLVSDVYRSQFQRFDMSPEQFIALLRDGNVEPSFYIDSANGRGQVYGTQSAGALLSFPPTAVWYLYPEGSFLYLDGGVLELGLVRDSVLNKTNDFQIFGESFENVAFIGVESLAVASTLCDSGTVSLPHGTICPIDYTNSVS